MIVQGSEEGWGRVRINPAIPMLWVGESGHLDHRGTLNHLTFLCLFKSQSPDIPSIWPLGGVWTNQKLKGTLDHHIKISAIFENYQQVSEFYGVILISHNPYRNVVLNNNFRFTETLSRPILNKIYYFTFVLARKKLEAILSWGILMGHLEPWKVGHVEP